jgi:hypothetical protein
LFQFQISPISCMQMLLLGLVIHYCCGVTSWAQLVFTTVDNILLSCGPSSNVVINERVFVPNNTWMLLVIVIVWKNQTSVNGSKFPAQLQASQLPST